LHWFCARSHKDDDEAHFEEDVKDILKDESESRRKEREQKVQAAQDRTTTVFDSLQLFAFDGQDAAQCQSWLEDNLAKQMQRCDVCIRQYHRGRRKFKEQLTE